MMIIKYFFEKQGLQDIKYVLLPFIFAIWLNFIKMEIFSISILWGVVVARFKCKAQVGE